MLRQTSLEYNGPPVDLLFKTKPVEKETSIMIPGLLGQTIKTTAETTPAQNSGQQTLQCLITAKEGKRNDDFGARSQLSNIVSVNSLISQGGLNALQT